MSPLLLFAVFALLLVLAVPIALSLGITAVLPTVFDPSFTVSAKFIIRSMVSGLDSFPLLAVPMFILSGIIMARGGISRRLFDIFSYFFGSRTAGMPCSVIVTCLFYGAISGSAPATVAAVGSMSIPVLLSLGYEKNFVTAVVAVAGGLGVIIPPSIPFIMFGMASGTSVSDLFLAGILPGLLIGLILMAYVYGYCRIHGEDRIRIDREMAQLRARGLCSVLREGFFSLLCPVIILGCIYSGIASPTEAAVISVFYALLISMAFYRSITLRDLPSILSEAVRTFAPLLFLLAAGTAFSRVLTLMEVPQQISLRLADGITHPVLLLLLVNLFLLLVGMVMDTTPAILILTPILLPITAAVGMHPVHFGVMMVVNLAIGFVTPPVGVNLFVASSLTKVPIMTIVKHALPMILCFLVALLFLTFIPSLSLALL